MITPNIEHLHYFTTVVETGSFTAAGRKLGRDRSSIGQAIANLEIDLGVTLFNRNGRVISLTSEGEDLYARARTLVQSYQSFCQYSQNIASNTESEIFIGVDFLTTNEEIAEIDAALSAEFPNVITHWQVHPTDHLDSLLESNQIDMAIRLYQNRDLPEDFHIVHLDNIAMSAVINNQISGQLSPARLHTELRKIPLITYVDADRILRTDRFELVQMTTSPHCALSIVKRKPSWGIFPASLVGKESDEYQRISIDTEQPLYARRIAVWHHNEGFGSVKQWLVAQLPTILGTSIN